MATDKLNISTQSPSFFGVIPTVSDSKRGVSGGLSSDNPFKGDNGYVGLVNSDLSNMSYSLPNGKISNCNTVCVA